MTIQNRGYGASKIYPGLCPEFLSDMTKELEGIMADAVNNDVKGIHEHLAMINNSVSEMLKQQLEQIIQRALNQEI